MADNNHYRNPGARDERDRNDRGRDDDRRDADGETLNNREVSQFANDAFRKGAEAMNKADYGKSVKWFGIEVDSGIAAFLTSAWTAASGEVIHKIAPRVQGLVLGYGRRFGVQGNALNYSAALALTGVNVATTSGPQLIALWKTHSDHREEYEKVAREIAPVLDDLKGRHSVGTFKGVSAVENEVLYAQHERMKRIHKVDTLGNWLGAAISAGPNLLLSSKEFIGTWNGKSIREVRQAHEIEKKKKQENGDDAPLFNRGAMQPFANFATGPVANRFIGSQQHKLNKTLQPHSAFEMIVELNKQAASKPDARSFQMPKTFQNPKGRPESCPLEEYIVRIMLQHQRDMADISPDYTELREALKEDLAAVARPMANAIRRGDMSALDLVRLIGEGKIIKDQGRAIANPEEVHAAIRHVTGRSDEPTHGRHAANDDQQHHAKTSKANPVIGERHHMGQGLGQESTRQPAYGDDEHGYRRVANDDKSQNRSHVEREGGRRTSGGDRYSQAV